jgi:hypothetical protein
MKRWKGMTTEERLDWLLQNNQSMAEAIEGMSARLDELGGVVIELEKQIRGLQFEGQKGRPRPVLKLHPAN